MVNRCDRTVILILLSVVLFLGSLFAIQAAPFYFTGYAYNTSNGILNGTNVSLYVTNLSSFQTATILSTLVRNESHGFFNLTVPDGYASSAYGYRPVIRYFNGSVDTDYVGQNLPDFPYSEFSTLGAIKFYLKNSVTINITAFNQSGSAVPFNYMVKDVLLGYPIYSSFTTHVYNTTFNLPSDRNYSIMIFPNMSFPISYDLSNLRTNNSNQNYTLGPHHVDVRFNTSSTLRRLTGFVTLNGQSNFDNLKMVAYLLEPQNMVSQDHPFPYNMSAWDMSAGPPGSDFYNTSNGFYNITLPGAAMTANFLLFAAASNGSNYYGSFKNISLGYSTDAVNSFNFSLQPLMGSVTNINLNDAATPGGTVSFLTKKVPFSITAGGEAVSSAHIEMNLDYSSLYANGSIFTWMADISPSAANLNISLLNNSVKQMNVFAGQYAPKETTYTATQLASVPLSITLSAFNPGEIDSAQDADLGDTAFQVGMYTSSATCSVPYPASSCSLLNSTQFDQFNPLTIIMGGGKLDFMLSIKATNITVKYVNVDLIASGPPDALFDSASSNQTQGASLSQAWRFGSQGPDIYDFVLVGMPYASNVDESAPFSVLLNKLYDENWNPVWNASDNTRGQGFTTVAYSAYADYNQTWLNTTAGGMPCSLTDQTADCYVNTTLNMIWVKIPHFSGVGPSASTTTVGNVSINSSAFSFNCTNSCNIYIDVTNSNFTLAQQFQNITINTSESRNNIVNYTIYKYNGTEFVFNATNGTRHSNYNFTLFNDSENTISRYRIDIYKRNQSATTWNFTLNYTTNASGFSYAQNLTINLMCQESWSCSEWSTCTSDVRSRTCNDANVCGSTEYKPTLTETCTSTSSSSSGGAGAGGSAGGIAQNVVGQFAKETWTSINPGEVATVKVANSAMGITEVNFAVEKVTYGATLKVEKMDVLPQTVSAPANKVYKNLKITETNLEKVLKEVTINFKVAKTWLTSNVVEKQDMALFRYNEQKWVELSTTFSSEDADYVYYAAKTPGFSYFVIAQKAGALPTETGAAVVEQEIIPAASTSETETVAPPVKNVIWPWIAILVIIAIIIAVVTWITKRK